MWRIHKIPLNESLLLCAVAVCTPIAPSSGVGPLPLLFIFFSPSYFASPLHYDSRSCF